MTEDIITELTSIKDLKLFPRPAMLAYRDKPVTAPQVGHELGAAYVLGGSVRRSGTRLRITAQLVETNTGHTLWAQRFDRELADVLDVQDEIARSIAQAFRISLTPQEERTIARKPTEIPTRMIIFFAAEAICVARVWTLPCRCSSRPSSSIRHSPPLMRVSPE